MKNPIYKEPAECSGCRACLEVCPRKCISMEKDSEHFVYPVIDEERCINCYRCEKVCPLKQCVHNTIQEAVVGTHSVNEVFKSASGGAFWALCQLLIPQGYLIAGVKWTEDLKVVYDIVSTLDEAQSFRKSKYIMPDTNGIFAKVKSLLRDGQKVMFTGSPCQVAACKKFVGDNDNLLLVDLVCHGAPNQDVFDREIEYLERKHKGKLDLFEFRQKKPINGRVNSRSARFVINNKEYLIGIADDPFLKGYYSRLFYRPSCETCHFARVERVGDITIADAWGVNDVYSEYNDLSGTSLILFNTTKGLDLRVSLDSLMKLMPVSVQWAIESNQQLRVPTQIHKNRKIFFEKFDHISFQANVDSCTFRTSFIKKLLLRIRNIVKAYAK